MAGTSLLLGGPSGCRNRVEAPEPARDFTKDTIDLPPLVPGTIVAPLTLDRASAIAALEREVPRTFGDITQRIRLPDSRRSFAFEVRREPFTVSLAADTILLNAVVHYRGRGWYDPPIGPDIQGGCGSEKEPPRARLRLRVVPRLSAEWRLRTRTQVDTLEPFSTEERDQCEVSFLNLDVTGKVLTGATAALRSLLPQVDRQLAGLDVKSPLEKIWVELQEPIRITDSLWLILQPSGVNLGRVRGSKETVGAQIGVSAAPRIVAGPKPVIVTVPLPALGPIRDEEGFSMYIEGRFDFRVMSGVLTTQLKGQKVKTPGGTFTVRNVKVFGVGGGRLAVGVDFSGSARGRVWLLGTPRYDAATGLVTVPDLDFETSTSNLLVAGAAWIGEGAIREFLRNLTVVPVGALMKQMESMAVKEMNQDLEPGVRLEVTIAQSEPAGMLVKADVLTLRVRATGSGRLVLGPELFETGKNKQPQATGKGTGTQKP